MKKFLYTLTIICTALLTVLPKVSQAQSEDQYSDAEIAAIAVAANEIDIKYAEIAREKSTNQEILNFANTMINDHKAVIEKAVELVTKLQVEPRANDLSKKLNEDAEAKRKSLREKNGAAFDEAYITNEVAYHKAVINAVRNVLIPDTENEQLKELLEAVLPALETHLEHAERVHKQIMGQ